MASSPLVKKLRIPAEQRLLVINAPEGYRASLEELPQSVEWSDEADGQYPFVQLFVKDSREFHELSAAAIAAVAYDGLFWICYPKKSAKLASDLSRDVVWKLMQGSGLRPVTQISIDTTWSAMRFRPEEKVGR